MAESIGNFDEFSDSYSQDISNALGKLDGESTYFSKRKVDVIRDLFKGVEPGIILDYGCGIGSLIPFLHEIFPESEICATDLSIESLRQVQRKYPYVKIFQPDEVDPGSCDLVVLSNVLHHVPPNTRGKLMSEICEKLATNGSLVVIEHNPLNPVTRRIVSNCVFDKGVILVKRRTLRDLLAKNVGLMKCSSRYFLYFPPSLSRLQFLERFLYYVPLGGQYMTKFERKQ